MRDADALAAAPALVSAPSAGSDGWALVRRFAPLALVVLSVALLGRDFPAAARALGHARPIAFSAIALFFVWNHVATLAWRALLRASGVTVQSLTSLVRLRIEGQAINQLVPAAGMAGEGMRAVRAAAPGELGAASLATVLDNVAGTMSGLVFSAGALLLHLQSHGGRAALRTLTITTAVALALLAVLVVLPFQLGHRLRPRSSPAWVRQVLTPFADNRVAIRRAFTEAVALRFVERLIAAVEIYVVFTAVGVPITVANAALVSAVYIVVSFAAFFLPGQLGAAEAAVVTTSTLLGIPAALGLSAALLRRARQLMVCGLGVVSMLLRRQPATNVSPLEKAG
jgi:uncharacterized membrane protein YbhN (UPF0104 family)